MSRKLSIYNKLVNEVPGIREKYINFRQSESSSLKAYAYLGLMNFQYHILRRKSVGELSYGQLDNRIFIKPYFCESDAADYGTPKDYADRLADYEVISFDVFDTLILRPFKKPTDLFYMLERDLNYPGLKRIRIEAEENARKFKQWISGNREVRIDEIWRYISDEWQIDDNLGISKEFLLELKYCFANPFFKEVVDILRAKNKKMIICSDMYLGKEYIKKLLSHCGYEDFADYIVSCDYGKSKSAGDLYKVIKEKYGENIIHIGDNSHSDIKMAKANGINAFYYANVNALGNKYRPADMSVLCASAYAGIVNGYLYNGLNKHGWEYEFGFIYGGLLVTGYCKYIHEYVKQHKVDKLLFLSRDGDVICKAYKLMYPAEADICEYVLWSRLAGTRLCAADYKKLFMERMVDHKVNSNYSFTEIFNTIESENITQFLYTTEPETLAQIFEREMENKLSLSDVLKKENAGVFKEFLNRHWDDIVNSYYDEREECAKYYGPITFGCENVLIIDSGWMGSGAITLGKRLEYMGIKSKGMVLGTLSAHSLQNDETEAFINSGKLISYCFSASHNRDLWKNHNPAKGHNLIVELLLSSDKPSFRAFKKDENGSYKFGESSEKINSLKVQEGILDFVKIFMKHFGDDISISGRDAFYPVSVLYKNEKWVKAILEKSEITTNIE